jgi:ubiquitin C-terminal hydrolase
MLRCYQNAILQTFVHSRRVKLLYQHHESLTSDRLGLDLNLSLLMNEMWHTGSSIVVPTLFLEAFRQRAPMFKGHNQHDSHEFIRYLLDMLSTDQVAGKSKGSRSGSKGRQVVSDLFAGEIERYFMFLGLCA